MVGKIVVRVRPSRSTGACMPTVLKPLILFLVLAALVGASGAGEAQARTFSRCSAALIHDWYVDGRIDRTYPVRCYREALRDIPEDQIVYGTLRDDLTRALASVIRNSDGPVTGDTPVPPAASSTGGGDGSGGGSSGSDGFFGWLASALGPDTAESVPVPLLVLAGLALLLMAAAGVSFVARRVQAKKAASEPPPTGPGL
jgi:hypothetical protein